MNLQSEKYIRVLETRIKKVQEFYEKEIKELKEDSLKREAHIAELEAYVIKTKLSAISDTRESKETT